MTTSQPGRGSGEASWSIIKRSTSTRGTVITSATAPGRSCVEQASTPGSPGAGGVAMCISSAAPGARAAKASSRFGEEREMRGQSKRSYTCAPNTRRRRFVGLAVFAAVLLALGGASASSAQHQPSGQPDTYVTSWDAIGSQAFTAAGLTPAEGHVIFAYLAIA